MDKILGSLRSKTALFALLLVILGVIQTNTDLIVQIIGEANIGWFTTAIGAIVYVLRWITTVPLAQK